MVCEDHGTIAEKHSFVCRYSWNGEPLLISNNQQIPHGEITCKSCDAPAVFEFQLMPPLVYMLQNNAQQSKTAADAETGMVEFGTVLVFSCSKSCWDDKESSFREETVFVQTDPDSEKLTTLY